MGSYFFQLRLRQLAAKTTKTAIGSFAFLGIASSIWLAIEQKLPQIARAETIDTDLAIDRRPNETYEALRERAIAAAKTAATENLATNQQATDVTVTVVIRDRGQIAPILSLKANRSEGFNSDPRQGLRYFDQARSLLRFDDVATNDSNNAPQKPLPNTTPSSSRTPANTNPGNARNSGGGTFSQPGRLVTPTLGQPANTTPFGQPGTTSPINTPSSQTQPGTSSVPQTSTTPTASPGTPINQPITNPNASPSTGLTPTPPSTPTGVAPSQPLTPSTSPLPETTPTTSPSGVTSPTTAP